MKNCSRDSGFALQLLRCFLTSGQSSVLIFTGAASTINIERNVLHVSGKTYTGVAN